MDLQAFGHDELHDDHMADNKCEAYDDVSNEPLVPSLVQAARKEELEYSGAAAREPRHSGEGGSNSVPHPRPVAG